jgi:hypothetical protein
MLLVLKLDLFSSRSLPIRGFAARRRHTHNECCHWSIQTQRIMERLLGFDDLPLLSANLKLVSLSVLTSSVENSKDRLFLCQRSTQQGRGSGDKVAHVITTSGGARLVMNSRLSTVLSDLDKRIRRQRRWCVNSGEENVDSSGNRTLARNHVASHFLISPKQ